MGRVGRVGVLFGGIALVALFLAGPSPAQIMFERTYGGSLDEEARCVQQTPDAGYVLAACNRSCRAGRRSEDGGFTNRE